jgi:hypothetical protein
MAKNKAEEEMACPGGGGDGGHFKGGHRRPLSLGDVSTGPHELRERGLQGHGWFPSAHPQTRRSCLDLRPLALAVLSQETLEEVCVQKSFFPGWKEVEITLFRPRRLHKHLEAQAHIN